VVEVDEVVVVVVVIVVDEEDEEDEVVVVGDSHLQNVQRFSPATH